jgi:hypothetical protein
MIISVSSVYCIIGYFCPRSSVMGKLIIPLAHASLITTWRGSEVLKK